MTFLSRLRHILRSQDRHFGTISDRVQALRHFLWSQCKSERSFVERRVWRIRARDASPSAQHNAILSFLAATPERFWFEPGSYFNILSGNCLWFLLMTPLQKLPDDVFRRNIWGVVVEQPPPIYSGGKPAWWLFAVESLLVSICQPCE